ncbi:helix-turn-helix domain-containing protein [Bacillus sp. FJAT-44742]|uniref:helix-turn-helix domain-containing protein n=1 Tax=Bacillus sp. FJAT-44742 TaxID=2014005 RepID=UPI000C244B85|nr:tetratricopeptide repeat protein [Bacillus sp. FJAT-44742]
MSVRQVGRVLSHLRQARGLKIEEVCRGICTREEYRDFELSLQYPRVDVLQKLSCRLQIELEDFFQIRNEEINDYGGAIENIIRRFIRYRDYAFIYEIVSRELEDEPLSWDRYRQQFLLWHMGICQYHHLGNADKALDTLEEALQLTYSQNEPIKQREVEIIVSKAIIHCEIGELEKAIRIYNKALNLMASSPHLNNPHIHIRVLYSLSKTYTDVEEYEKSCELIEQAIDLCIDNETMYLFGELYFQLGENYINLGRIKDGEMMIQRAIVLFEAQKHTEMVELSKKELGNLLKVK